MRSAATAPGAQAKFLQGNLFRHVAVMSLTSSGRVDGGICC